MSVARYFNPRLRQRLIDGDEPDWLRRHSRRRYIVACVRASVPWGCRKAIEQLRIRAKIRTLESGIRHVLDHVVPLNHPYVCGLNVPENLQVLTYLENQRKGNDWVDEQHQLELML